MTAFALGSGPATRRQITAIHSLKATLELDDTGYRDLLEGETRQRSAKALSAVQAARVIDRMKVLSGQARSTFKSGLPDELPTSPPAKGARLIDGDYVPKLRALWISGYDLGVFHDRTDAALLAFVARQTGIVHTRWLRDAEDAKAVIEALKSWIAREAGVAWPGREAEALDIKRAVVTAQWLRLVKLGAVTLFLAEKPLHDLDRYAFQIAGKQGWQWFDGDDYATVQSALGKRLRQALARKHRRAS